ncbi:ribonuclease Z [Reichenbachiella sp. MSK19-1]|uniref:ribonuclease Z n=1 Tax=Reichenbachiella sp. MSK19-1 TaxID=1897631 RepID=UPI000E6BE97A|nr:ribonuclease Z [Reichenbachiella sp. MSK19-1]RJE70666.1 ribonuclease Z [Reichenbachiella sp. MSK19-1]
MSFSVKILGSNASVPAHNRNQTSQLLTMMQVPFLIDCGEGTQVQLKKNKIKAQKIDYIFISHLHGDHYYGLIGLISSLHLYGRKKDLNIYGPPGLKEILAINLKHSQTALNYKINLTEWIYGEQQLLMETQNITVHSFPLNHRIPCSGFIFREKPKKRRIDRSKVIADIPPSKIISLKNGNDVFDQDGNLQYKNEDYTLDPAPSRAYAFCSDTKYDEAIIPYIHGVDILYHEATFMDNMTDRAAQTHHTTTIEAGLIAQKAQVNKLLIGHFSTRYKELLPMLAETKTIFENTELALEGYEFSID